MVLVGAVVLPHGTLPFDNPVSPSSECRERSNLLPPIMQKKISSLYEGIINAAEEIARLQPDLLVLHTPHGFCLSDSMAIYGNAGASGTAEWSGHWKEFDVSVELDQTVSERLYGYLVDRQVRIEMVKAFSQSFDAPLRWGEVVPLWYLLQKTHKKPKVVILTHPRKLGTGQVEIEKLNVGRLISDFLCNIDHKVRIAVAISGDLSHTYATSCTDELYLPDPSSQLSQKVNHEAAILFERAIEGWVKGLYDVSLHNGKDPLPECSGHWNPGNGMAWITKAAGLHPQALSCGMTGFMVLHGLLAGYVAKGFVFKPKVHACEAPTYYGMLAGTFTVT